MVKAKVKSREQELQEQWIKYFKNIEKENDLIHLILKYCKEIEPKIKAMFINSSNNIEDDEKDRKSFRKENDDESFAYELKEAEESLIPENVESQELRYVLSCVAEKANDYKQKIKEQSQYIQNQFEKLIKPYDKYVQILKETHEQTKMLKPNINPNRFESLALKNFKGFSKEDSIKIKPITLIYGPNSYGKSSILQALLLLNQTVNEGKDFRDVSLLPNGPMVNLGQFKDFLNKNAENSEIKIEVSLPGNHYFDDEDDIPDKAIQDTSILAELYFSLYFTLEKNKIILPKIEIFSKQTDYQNPNKPVQMGKEKIYTLALKNSNQKDEIYEIIQESDNILGINYYKKETPKISFFRLEDFITGNPFEKLEEIIKNLVYVSSYRTKPERYYTPENNRRRYVGKQGEYTAEILGYDTEAQDKEVKKKVNEWLYKIAGYELSLKKDNNVNSVNLNDEKTKIQNINLLDLGSGIAQVLPIITQTFKSRNEMILIEEPEIHLHPKAQAELGGMLADAVKEKTDNTFIIETHSENLLLRLEKLIRQNELSKDDVSVIYVDKNENGSYCIPLILDDEGDIENINEIPGGFFEEGFEELFGISK